MLFPFILVLNDSDELSQNNNHVKSEMNLDIGTTAKRLRWAVWIFWAGIVLAYVLGRLGVETDFLRIRSRVDGSSDGPVMIVADAAPTAWRLTDRPCATRRRRRLPSRRKGCR